MFCPKCGSILKPKKTGEKTVMACGCGGYESKDAETAKITEIVGRKPKHEERSMEAAETTAGKANLPLTEIECPKCHNDTAYYWTRQTRAADEGETKFHQCARCGHKWREYG